MKTLFYTLLFIFSLLSCKAQSPIIPLFGGNEYASTENAYYKDTDNDFDKYIGTWQYTSGSTRFKIILDKKTLYVYTSSISNTTYYTDYLYGEFQFIDTFGQEVANTLANMSNTSIDVSEHRIFGNRIVGYKSPPACEACTPDERRIRLSLEDPVKDFLDYKIFLRTVPNLNNNTILDIELTLHLDYSYVTEDETDTNRLLPYGTYRLIKQ